MSAYRQATIFKENYFLDSSQFQRTEEAELDKIMKVQTFTKTPEFYHLESPLDEVKEDDSKPDALLEIAIGETPEETSKVENKK
jgi:hypothetical protein